MGFGGGRSSACYNDEKLIKMIHLPLKQAMIRKGYKWFEGYLNVNIIGVRSSNGRVNEFDDFLYLSFQDERGRWVVRQYPITTEPGLTMLKAPVNSKGTAILIPDQYRSAYSLDYHAGKYEAVCQRLGEVCVYRDNDLDDELDIDELIDCGYFGINIHKAGIESELVNNWSAGCQVFQRAYDFEDFMRWVKKSAAIYGNSFSYTLLLESDFVINEEE